jgi:glyoxylase-like metal-dependent hydrolase (beta-lactamase superfamily II)
MSPAGATIAPSCHVGKFICHPIPDGDLVYPRAAMAPPEADEATRNSFPEQLTVPYTPLLVVAGAHRVLLDTGAGPLAPSTGGLRANLQVAGFQNGDIDFVVLSHAHPDHIGGLLAEDGSAMFPNARILMSREEYDLWHSSELRQRLGSGAVYGNPDIENMIGIWIDRYLAPLGDRLEWVDAEAEIVPGITTFAASGHTPFHLGVAVASGSESLLYTADAFALTEHIIHPEWTSSFDLDRQQTVVTRGRLLDRAATDHSLMFHYHFPRVGAVIRQAAGFGWHVER